MVVSLFLSRKNRYIIQTFLFFIFGYFLFIVFDFNLWLELVINSLFIIIFLIFAHFPNVKINNILYGSILPVQLAVSSTMFFYFFPNLSYYFKLFILISFVFLFYIVAFVDNIFFVVQDREEQIPLYRAAITWAQILSVIISIPLFASISKLNLLFIWQSIAISFSGMFISLYHFWIFSFDDFLKKAKVGEFIWLNLLVGYLVFIASSTFSFIPSESFLRSLFISSVLMFSLNFVQSHLKNDINEKFLYQSFFICIFFLITLLVFI